VHPDSAGPMGNEIKPFTDFKGDVEQLSQEFMGRIEKAKPGKKFTKKPRSISHEAWSYYFLVLIILLVKILIICFYLA